MSKRVGFFVNGLDSKGKLETGVKDISRIYRVFTDRQLGACDEMLSSMEKDISTKKQFRDILDDVFSSMEAMDQLIFYFSGHGKNVENSYHLVFGNDVYNFDDLLNNIRTNKIKKAIIILDACFSGAATVSKGIEELDIQLPEGIVILSSSDAFEKSYERDDSSNSVFTNLLCECIETGNDGVETDKNEINANHIQQYFNEKNIDHESQESRCNTANANASIWIAHNKTKKQEEVVEDIDNPPNSSTMSDVEKLDYKNTDFTEKPNGQFPIDQLNWNMIDQYIKEKNINIDSSLSKKDILKKINFIKHEYVINAVILNFTNSPDLWIPQSKTIIYVDDKKGSMKIITGPIVEQLDLAVKYILKQIDDYFYIQYGKRINDYVIPQSIIREAISNALVHRCYDECNDPVKIHISIKDQNIQIINPGNFLGNYLEMLADNNNKFSTLRNPRMGDFALCLGLAETKGNGFKSFRAYNEKYGEGYVSFRSDGHFTTLKLKFIENIDKGSDSDPDEESISTVLTPKLGIFKDFIGREKELYELNEIVNKSNIVSITGIGGIGKSSLASYYMISTKKSYSHYGYISAGNHLQLNLVANLRISLKLTKINPEEAFHEVIDKLRNLKGKVLLIIDDIKDIQEQKESIETILNLSTNDNFKIILTSRAKIQNVCNYTLSTLDLKMARDLFLEQYKTNETTKVDQILQYIDCHTFFIKLITLTLHSNGYTLDDIISSLQNNNLTDIILIDENDGHETTINEILTELFSMQKLTEPYILLLKKLSILPSIEMSVSFLEKTLQENNLHGKLNFLTNRGWLIHHNDNYKLHQIIKEYLLKNHSIDYMDIEIIIKNFNIIFEKNKEELNYYEFYYNSYAYLGSIMRVVKSINVHNESIITLLQNIGEIYNFFAKYVRALEAYKLSYSICQNVYDKGSSFIAIAANNIAIIHGKLEQDKEALGFYNIALQIYETQNDKDNIEILNFYSNLATTYRKLKNNDMASMYHEKFIKIVENNPNMNQLDVSIGCNNYALFLQTMGKQEEALKYFTKAIKIKESLFGDIHPDAAIIYSNLGVLYMEKNNQEAALTYLNKALKARLTILTDTHPDVANIYLNLADVYKMFKECQKAIEYANKAILIYKMINTYTHPKLHNAEALLENIQNNIKKEHKLSYRKKGRYCNNSQ